MTDAIANWFAEHFGDILPPEAVVFIVSMLPILESNGGIVIARLLNVELLPAIIWAFLGNILPVPFLMLFLVKFMNFLKRFKLFQRPIGWLEQKGEKNRVQVEKYGFWGLAVFVGIPGPGAGVWTGALVAVLIQLNPKRAVISIILGMILNMILMFLVMYGGFSLILHFFSK